MKGFYGFILCLVLIQKAISLTVDERWEEFKVKYNKHYADNNEENERKEIYLNNLQTMETHNERFARGEEQHGMEENETFDMLKLDVLKDSLNEPEPESGDNPSSTPIPNSAVTDAKSIWWTVLGTVLMVFITFTLNKPLI